MNRQKEFYLQKNQPMGNFAKIPTFKMIGPLTENLQW